MWKETKGTLAVLSVPALILLSGVWIGNYNASSEYKAVIAELNTRNDNLEKSKVDALREQRLALAQDKTEELKRTTAMYMTMCNRAATDAAKSAESAAGVVEATEQATKEKVKAIQEATSEGGKKP